LFWKKKKKSEPELFTFETDCRRGYVRVGPPPWAPVEVELGDELADLRDVSAGGLACQCPNARVGDVVPVRIDLPGESVAIESKVEIRSVDADGVCHARFLNLTVPMVESIHRYALGVQKSLLKLKKELHSLEELEDDGESISKEN
jgi:hypothetical protein